MKIAVIIHDSNNEHGSGENRCIEVFNQYIKSSDGKLKLFEHTSEINGKKNIKYRYCSTICI